MSTLKFNGLNKLSDSLTRMTKLEAVKTIVKQNGAEMTRKATENAVFTKGYATGQTKRSISASSNLTSDGLTAVTQAGTDYAGYVEYGTRYMAAQPFIKPAFDVQKVKFKRDLDQLVKR